ncbi:MAG: hypothetical protein LBB13_02770 [Rickettsiales bacterium]|jgi:lipopolysaccharide transport protein LptA|nr:hypothetical protein [Rickettsiales bacterium]
MYKFAAVILFLSFSFNGEKNIFGSQKYYSPPNARNAKDVISIESDEVRMKKSEKIITFTGNVKILKDNVDMLAKKTAVLHYIENNNRIEPKTIDMIDVIVIRGNNIKITGDKGSYNFINSMLTIENSVVVNEKNSTIFTDKVLYNTLTEEIEMFGKKMKSDPVGRTTIIINDTKTFMGKSDGR